MTVGQKKYLAQLPEDYSFPLFSARQAVELQRRSGYQDTAAAPSGRWTGP